LIRVLKHLFHLCRERGLLMGQRGLRVARHLDAR
jgi:hypothetical protein